MRSNAYQVILLGRTDDRGRRFQAMVAETLADLGLNEQAIIFLDESEGLARNRALHSMAVFFGAPDQATDTQLLRDLIEDSVVIAPLVSNIENVSDECPPLLRHINALSDGPNDSGLRRLVSLVLETFRLLRRERRVFISYRRRDAQPVANALYEALDSRGFDVFIDVRSVPPAVDFQSVLWHRLSDSDVVLLIDTPGFRGSRWTVEELARANALNIQILHLLWPGQSEDAQSAFSHFSQLSPTDFWSLLPLRGRWIKRRKLLEIVDLTEQLRARAVAARYRYLTDNFCDASRDLGFDVAVQPEGYVLVKTPGGQRLLVAPAIGVPTSDQINTFFNDASERVAQGEEIWVIYDNRGVLTEWLEHLNWLDSHLPLRTVQMAGAFKRLQELV